MADDAALTVELSPEASRIVRAALRDGRFGAASEFVEAAVVAWDEAGPLDGAHLADLRASLEEADAAIGRGEWFTVDEVCDALLAKGRPGS